MQRLNKNPIPWNDKMTAAVTNIKQKVKSLPKLDFPTNKGTYIIETNASDHSSGGLLIERTKEFNGHDVEEICACASGTFKAAETNYPSSHKEILAVKRTISEFKYYLMPREFICRTDLKHTPDNKQTLHCKTWFDSYDFKFEYKKEYFNCLVAVLSQEAIHNIPYSDV